MRRRGGGVGYERMRGGVETRICMYVSVDSTRLGVCGEPSELRAECELRGSARATGENKQNDGKAKQRGQTEKSWR